MHSTERAMLVVYQRGKKKYAIGANLAFGGHNVSFCCPEPGLARTERISFASSGTTAS